MEERRACPTDRHAVARTDGVLARRSSADDSGGGVQPRRSRRCGCSVVRYCRLGRARGWPDVGGAWVLSKVWKQEPAVESRPPSSGDRALDLREALKKLPGSRQTFAAARLARAAAVNLVVAWRIFLMTLLSRDEPDLPPEVVFSELEIRVLRAFAAQHRVRPPPPRHPRHRHPRRGADRRSPPPATRAAARHQGHVARHRHPRRNVPRISPRNGPSTMNDLAKNQSPVYVVGHG